jgi:hypothetical protein
VGEDGASALFYNPANLGKILSPTFEPVNIGMHLNGGFVGNADLDFYKATSLSSWAPHLALSPDTYQGMSLSVLPSFATRYLAIGMLAQSELGASVDAANVAHYRSRYQLVPTVATGFRLAEGIVRIGYSFQWVNQTVGQATNAAGTAGYDQKLAKGSGFSHNAGAALTLPIAYLPSFNVVARNILGTHYTSFSILPLGQNVTGPPADDPMSFDASFSLQPKLGQGLYVNFVTQMRDFTNSSSTSLFQRLAVGLEFSLRDTIFLRGGFGSGYPAAGIGLRRKAGELSLTWYSEELGRGFREKQDTRYMLQFQVRAF